MSAQPLSPTPSTTSAIAMTVRSSGGQKMGFMRLGKPMQRLRARAS
jgi:hypothetical protein